MDYISALKILDKHPGEIADVRIPSDKRNLCGKIADRLLNGVFNGFSSAFDMFMDESVRNTTIFVSNGKPYPNKGGRGVSLKMEKTELLGEATKYFRKGSDKNMELTLNMGFQRDLPWGEEGSLTGDIQFNLSGAGNSDYCLYQFSFDRDDTARSLEREIRKFITPILTRYLKLVIKNSDIDMSNVSV